MPLTRCPIAGHKPTRIIRMMSRSGSDAGVLSRLDPAERQQHIASDLTRRS